eukprot:TRINITY_DN43768_c0_g1_i1.p1 TRINITY_DN43768_c0_g1~~TRINITY_DN43768_c0_g1_i1.p1  ORF type:complete len:292 (+),score=89.46 TRINITY_DN43768_c0_g1_i1:45-920(+)
MLAPADAALLLGLVMLASLLWERIRWVARRKALRMRNWTPGTVYLYTAAAPNSGTSLPDIRTLALTSAFDLLGLRCVVVESPDPHNQLPLVEVDGRQYGDYYQIINAVCVLSTIPGAARDFQVRGKGYWREDVLCAMILSSLRLSLFNHVWWSREARNRPGDGWLSLASLWALWQALPRLGILTQWEGMNLTTPHGFNLEGRIKREMTAIERHLMSPPHSRTADMDPVRFVFRDGLRPGVHDCVIYAAIKVIFDPRLKTGIRPEDYQKSAAYLRFFESLQDVEKSKLQAVR